jgi:hypothetical protein
MKETIHTFTTWVFAALTNAFISASCLSLAGYGSGWGESWTGMFMLTLIFTLLFSTPAIFIFWITFMCTPKNDAAYLFHTLLKCTIIVATISAIVFCLLFYNEFKNYTSFLGLSVVVAGVLSVLAHHRFIVNTCKINIALIEK